MRAVRSICDRSAVSLRNGWPAVRRAGLSGWRGAVLVLVLLAASLAGQEQSAKPPHQLRFGFSAGLMQDTNENDSRAALKVWVDTILKAGQVQADRDFAFCRSQEEMLTGLRSESLDAVAVLAPEFFHLRQHVKLERFVVGVIQKSPSVEYVLLVRRETLWAGLGDLRGAKLKMLRSPRMSLALPWLDAQLLASCKQTTAEYFSAVMMDNRLAQVVLPVYFGKIDACLVPAAGFRMMCELNPQVETKLKVLATSPAYIPSLLCFRAGFAKGQADRFIFELERLHTKPAGEQVLKVFQTEKMMEYPADTFTNTLRLLENLEEQIKAVGTNHGTVTAEVRVLEATEK